MPSAALSLFGSNDKPPKVNMIPPPNQRPTMQQLADQANGTGDVTCPGCGRRLFAYKRTNGKTRIIRYEECKTPGCERKFKTKQSYREIIEEVKPKDIKLSSSGNGVLYVSDEDE